MDDHRHEYCEAACGSGACWPAQLKRGVVCSAGYEGVLEYAGAVCESASVSGAGTFGGVSGECVRSCVLGAWGPWSPCSSGCGAGTQWRVRSLLVAPEAPALCGALYESRACAGDCLACNLTEWEGVDECTAGCGGGRRNYKRAYKYAASGAPGVALAQARSCHEIWQRNTSVTNGTYEIAVGVSAVAPEGRLRVRCLFKNGAGPDVGGWTLVAYLGRIDVSKKQTTGVSSAYGHQALFYDYGVYDPDAPERYTTFSRPRTLGHIFNDSAYMMVEWRGNERNRMLIPLVRVGTTWFNELLPAVSHIVMTNDGGVVWQNRTTITVYGAGQGNGLSEVGPVSTRRVGYDWNLGVGGGAVGEDCDNCGRTYGTALNHRSLLYWEREDEDVGGGVMKQWFAGTPMQMGDSTGALNSTLPSGRERVRCLLQRTRTVRR